MRSYYAHLETAMGAPLAAIEPKPVFRSSAIFPIIQKPGISTRVIFLGYWILKRQIKEIACVVTLRTEKGTIVSRRTFQITEAKTYNIEAAAELERAGIAVEDTFNGSIEVEFFSTVNLVFPYPAVAVNYYGPNFSSVVHTAQRIYNDFEDRGKNSQTAVPESGFNIYAEDDKEPFVSFINGSVELKDASIHFQFFNCDNEILKHKVYFETLLPYEIKIVYPSREIDLKKFLKGKVGSAKATFSLEWIFPRLVVGNIQSSLPALTITHTYYDCSCATSDSDYWRPAEDGWHPASLMIPLTAKGSDFTNVYFYPIYSPSSFDVDIEIYTPQGKLLGAIQKTAHIVSPKDELIPIRLNDLCRDLGITPEKELAARIIAHPCALSRLPARIKLGLDVGKSSTALPCNICTNLQPFNPALEAKQRSFKWAPLLSDHPDATVWIMNSTPRINYTKEAIVDVVFFRESDTQTLMRQYIIPAHGFIVIRTDVDAELRDFFEDKIGWFTANTTNPYTTTYYFSNSPAGVVGGDHGF